MPPYTSQVYEFECTDGTHAGCEETVRRSFGIVGLSAEQVEQIVNDDCVTLTPADVARNPQLPLTPRDRVALAANRTIDWEADMEPTVCGHCANCHSGTSDASDASEGRHGGH